MVRVRKSPNIISTTGRMPVIAAPTATPVKPASEIGVSRTRSVPNSSTSPDRTLNGVPASATSSPRMQTRGSRRISSASASRTACAKVSSRAPTSTGGLEISGIDVLLHFIGLGIGSGHGKLDGLLDVGANFRFDTTEAGSISQFLFNQPVAKLPDRIARALPLLLLFF